MGAQMQHPDTSPTPAPTPDHSSRIPVCDLVITQWRLRGDGHVYIPDIRQTRQTGYIHETKQMWFAHQIK